MGERRTSSSSDHAGGVPVRSFEWREITNRTPIFATETLDAVPPSFIVAETIAANNKEQDLEEIQVMR
jgi:hypothetical protein